MLRLWKKGQAASYTPHEGIFLDRYTLIFSWALDLTKNHQQAEDLTQDSFLDFTHSKPDLSQIRNIDAFLYQCVRNLHRSQLYRHLRRKQLLSSVFEYDSAIEGLHVADTAYLLQVWDQLRRVCRFACQRKESSKSGSIFILRFFHEYMLSEAARIAKISPKAVDKQLHLVRSEVRLYLEYPARLRFIKEPECCVNEQRANFGSATSSEAFLRELRDTIYSSCHGNCLSGAQIHHLYAHESEDSIDCAKLAHIVSCPRCLDSVNHKLDLPLLEDRNGGKDGPSDQSSSSDSDDSANAQTSMAKPKSSQMKQWKRRTEALREHEPHKLMLLVDGVPRVWIPVKHGHNEVDVNLEASESGPLFLEVVSEQDVRLLSLHITNPPPEGAFQQEHEVNLSEDRRLSLSVRFETLAPTIHLSYENSPGEGCGETERLAPQDEPVFLRISPSFSGWNRVSILLFRHRWSAVLSGILIACLILYQTKVTTVSASTLLAKSEKWESNAVRNPSQVIHHEFVLEEHSRLGGQLLSRRSVETWQNPQKHTKLSRLYDEHGKLLESSSDQNSVPPSAKNIWQFEPDAQNFQKFAGQIQKAKIVILTNQYEILAPTASLTLDRVTYRPIAETLILDERAFRFEETGIGVLPEKETPLDISMRSVDRPLPLRMNMAGHLSVSRMALDEAEIRARFALHQIGADIGDPIEVHQETRQKSSAIVVEGILPSQEQKEEALKSLSGIPHLYISLKTQDEAVLTIQPPTEQTIPSPSKESDRHSPIEKQLRDYCGSPEAVETFSRHTFDLVEALTARSAALRLLEERYPNSISVSSSSALNASSLELLIAMTHDHRQAMKDETAELADSLKPILLKINTAPFSVSEEGSMFDSVQRIRQLTWNLLFDTDLPNTLTNSQPSHVAQELLGNLARLENQLNSKE